MNASDIFSDQLETTALAAVSASVVTAAQCGLLEALKTTPRSAESLGRELDLDPFALERVLEVLTLTGIVAGSGDGYRRGRSISDDGNPLRSLSRAIELWSFLPEFLRTGRGLHFHGRSSDREGAYARAVRGLGEIFADQAAELAQAMVDRPPLPARILDVGAGSGVWSLAMLRCHLDADAVALDLPGVTEVFRGSADERGLASRTHAIGADYHEHEPAPAAYGRVLLGNVLHLETAEDAQALVRRYARAVAPGGALVIIDAMADESDHARLHLATYALHLAMRTGRGIVHPEPQLRRWLARAGMTEIERLPLGGGAMAALLGRRPRSEGPTSTTKEANP